MSGLFLTLEGPEGSGKSTQVELLRQALADLDPVFLREPGGTALGEEVRQLLLHGRAMSPVAEMHLFMAARAELLAEVIEPALARGRVVVLDRYHDSTLAYQGGGRGLAVSWPSAFPKPDRTYLLVLDPGAALGRTSARGVVPGGAGRLDRMESEPLDFHRRVAEAYDRMAAAEPSRFVRIDGSLPAADICARIAGDVRRLVALRRLAPSSS